MFLKEDVNLEKSRYKFNLFDIVVIVVILAVAFLGYKYLNRESVAETHKIQYTFELTDNPEGFGENIKIGDRITDNVKNYYMGQVVDVKIEPCKKLINDTEIGMVREAVVPGRETAIVTVEADVTESASDLKVNGYYTVKVGLEVAVKGNGYAGRGYILNVDRQGGAA